MTLRDSSYSQPRNFFEVPCQCASEAIERGWLELDPDCKANRCKDLRAVEQQLSDKSD